MTLRFVQFSTGAAVGADGVATATGYSSFVNGEVLAVAVHYGDAPPAGTTDFTLSDDADPLAESILTLANQSTDIKIYPRRILETNDGTNLTTYGRYAVYGRLKAVIAQANANDFCNVTVWIEE